MDWYALREQIAKRYGQAAQFFLFQNILMYLFACVAAHDVVSLPGYIAFLNHCCLWR